MRADWCVSSWFRIKNTHSLTTPHTLRALLLIADAAEHPARWVRTCALPASHAPRQPCALDVSLHTDHCDVVRLPQPPRDTLGFLAKIDH